MTLIGSAFVVLLGGVFPRAFSPVRVVLIASTLMVILGIAFAAALPIAVLVGLSIIGPLNPSGGDVSAFLPAEQTMLSDAIPKRHRTAAFARFSLVASLGGACGSLLAAMVGRLRRTRKWIGPRSVDTSFWLYAAGGLLALLLYVFFISVRRKQLEGVVATAPQGRLGPSRRTVFQLAGLFSLDAAGGGFVLNSLVALWLTNRFSFDLKEIGSTLAVMSLLSAVSSLAASRLVHRFGPVRTMVFTHIPAQVFLMLAALAPNPSLAVFFLCSRALTASLDVPARTAFVMNVVTEEERAAAAAFTNIPRSLASSSTPFLAGWMLSKSTVGWPLIAGALCKLTYDGLLFVRFRHLDKAALAASDADR